MTKNNQKIQYYRDPLTEFSGSMHVCSFDPDQDGQNVCPDSVRSDLDTLSDSVNLKEIFEK